MEYIHSKGFVHRDIKPENFLIGSKENSHKIYAIDFGLSKRYISAETDLHIPYRDNKNMNGTARYVSVSTHIGIEQSRRDDIESVIYTLIYLLKGSLPWQKITANNEQDKSKKIMEAKINFSPTDFLHDDKYVSIDILGSMLEYIRSLKFEEQPDYSSLRRSLEDIAKNNLIELDGKYDWIDRIRGPDSVSHPIIANESHNKVKKNCKVL